MDGNVPRPGFSSTGNSFPPVLLVFLFLWLAFTIESPADHNVLLVNDTGLMIARIEVDDRKIEKGSSGLGTGEGKILMKITPEKHHLRVVFVGGAEADWEFDFKDVRQVIFGRQGNRIEAAIE